MSQEEHGRENRVNVFFFFFERERERIKTISLLIDAALAQADKVVIRLEEEKKQNRKQRIWREKLTAEEAVAVQEESPTSADHDDKADHHHRRHHRRDVDVLWKWEGSETELWSALHIGRQIEGRKKNPSSFPIWFYWSSKSQKMEKYMNS